MYNIDRFTYIYDKSSDKKLADPLISMKKIASTFFKVCVQLHLMILCTIVYFLKKKNSL